MISHGAKQTVLLGYQLGKKLISGGGKRRVICCYGELGSGKTTFIQGLAQGLTLKGPILSSTFIIVRQYQIKTKPNFHFFHLDLYRLVKKEEIVNLGLKEILTNPYNLVAVEWPEKLQDVLPVSRIEVRIKILTLNQREIIINYL